MPAIRKNQPIAAKRRTTLFVTKNDGVTAADRATDFTDIVYVDLGDGNLVLAQGTMVNKVRTLTFAAIAYTYDHTTNHFTAAGHNLEKGDLIQLANVGGAPPAGSAVATNYYAIIIDVNTFQLANSRANAYAGTALVFTDNGTGANTIITVAASTRALDGQFYYEFAQPETNVQASELTVVIISPTFLCNPSVCPMDNAEDVVPIDGPTIVSGETDVTKLTLQIPFFDADGQPATVAPSNVEMQLCPSGGAWTNTTNAAALAGAQAGAINYTLATAETATPGSLWLRIIKVGYRTVLMRIRISSTNPGQDVFNAIMEDGRTYGDGMRLKAAILAGVANNFETGIIKFYSLDGSKLRLTVTIDVTGRLTSELGDLT